MDLPGRKFASKIGIALIALLALGGLLHAGSGHFNNYGGGGFYSKFKEAVFTLPDIELSKFLRHTLWLHNIDDHDIDLGGIGSDLFYERDNRRDYDDDDDYGFWSKDWFRGGRDFGWFRFSRRFLNHRNDEGQTYWMITDRGPNGEDPRTFPVSKFTPYILKVRATDDDIKILQAIPITGWNVARDGVTGLPNLNNTTQTAPASPDAATKPVPEPLTAALNEKFFNCFGSQAVAPMNANGMELGTNPHGLDSEGLVRTKDGIFWVVEEYGPSILKIGPRGKVLKRYFPQDFLALPGNIPPAPGIPEVPIANITGYQTDDSPLTGFPEIYGTRRRLNRGFEGIALSPDEKTIYIALQSPFLSPTGNSGRDSIFTRFLAFDLATEKVVKEFVYQFQPFAEFDPASDPTDAIAPNRPRDMKVSALAMVDQHRMLVLERTDFVAKVFMVDLRTATNILGSKWDNALASTNTSLEIQTLASLTGDLAFPANPLSGTGLTPGQKTLIATLDSTIGLHGMAIPQKIEGLTILDKKTIAIANDNDFGIAAGTLAETFEIVGDSCKVKDSGRESQIIVIRLDQPLY